MRHFHSSLSLFMKQFVEFKKFQQYDYTTEAKSLVKFDQFLQAQHYIKTVLDLEIINAYIDSVASLEAKSRANRLGVVRQFSKYLNARYPESTLIDHRFKIPERACFYLYTNEEIIQLMTAATQLPLRDKLRSSCLRFLIGLLSCTGLRINEALSLIRADVDLINLRLFIKKGKFSKQRYVPIDESTVVKIRAWYEVCERYNSGNEQSPLFMDQHGEQLSYDQLKRPFTQCRQQCSLMAGRNSPRFHDFRHTFACNCLLKWQAAGEVNTKLPILATVLGHVDIQSLMIYLHISSAQMSVAATHFNIFFKSDSGER